MRLLSNLKEFRAYRKLRTGLPTDSSIGFPCFVYERVTCWAFEEDAPKYLYREDLEKMLKKLLDAESAGQ